MEEQLINIEEVIRVFRKRKKLIATITLGFTLFSAIVSYFVIKPKYEANTKIFIGKEATGENQNYSQSDVVMYQTLMKTYSEVIKTNDLILKAAEDANIDLKADEILDRLTIITIADTQILEIRFESVNPKESRDLIEGITKEFIEISKELYPNANIRILQKVTLPETPISPNKIINTQIGFLLGLMGSISFSFILEFLETMKIKEELDRQADKSSSSSTLE